MKRREFITLVGGGAAPWLLKAHAQQPGQMRRIGVLMNNAENDTETKAQLVEFRQGLQRFGWSEDRNIHIDARFAADRPDQYQVLAKELVALQPDVIFHDLHDATRRRSAAREPHHPDCVRASL